MVELLKFGLKYVYDTMYHPVSVDDQLFYPCLGINNFKDNIIYKLSSVPSKAPCLYVINPYNSIMITVTIAC